VIGLREALVASGAWIGVGLLFDVFVYFAYEHHWFGLDIPDVQPDGHTAAILYLSGHVVEKSLGIDNVDEVFPKVTVHHAPVIVRGQPRRSWRSVTRPVK
jgi:hypothetical protein